jgi:hypothetical protein
VEGGGEIIKGTRIVPAPTRSLGQRQPSSGSTAGQDGSGNCAIDPSFFLYKNYNEKHRTKHKKSSGKRKRYNLQI